MARPLWVDPMTDTENMAIQMNQAILDRESTAALQARDLTGGASTAKIELDGQTYTLRITRQNKLILTK